MLLILLGVVLALVLPALHSLLKSVERIESEVMQLRQALEKGTRKDGPR